MNAPAPRLPISGPFEFLRPSVEVGPQGTRVSLPYRITSAEGPLELTEVVQLPVPATVSDELLAAVRVLHLFAGVSYYKAVAPTALVVPRLSQAERAAVTALYDSGLREFAYRNGFDVPLPVELVEDAGDLSPVHHLAAGVEAGGSTGAPSGALVPVGGGKDSALVASLVPDGRLFSVNPVGAQVHLAEALGRPLLAVTRTLAPELRHLVAAGVPNGHVPVTAITSAVAVLTAVAVGAADVVMGIERSADEPSLVTPDGVPVNHQYSKSSEAERLLQAAFEPTGVRWFSLLRPLTELAIGAAVAARGLGADIVSCNRVFTVWNETTASRTQKACGECAKCLFTALMLAPGSEPEAIATQYGSALLDRTDHVDGVRELWSDEKPFDCVGERHESAAAVSLLADLPGWSHQEVISTLRDEARRVLAADRLEAGRFLEIGPVDDLPAEYRQRVADLRADVAAVVASVGGPDRGSR
ncbi:MAG: hypothetical protein GX643_00590 [Acidimicrobiales bacterium]|nr:hypothetical protein [Acidimicrobiales bacterium]